MSHPHPGAQPPPIPPAPGHRPPPPPAKKSRAGCWIALVVAAVLGVMVVAILAAIALPAYKDYVTRSKVATATAMAFPMKLEIAGFHAENGHCPTIDDTGFDNLQQAGWPTETALTVGQGPGGACTIDVRLRDEDPALDGKSLRFEYDADGGQWQCGSDIDDRYLPTECRS